MILYAVIDLLPSSKAALRGDQWYYSITEANAAAQPGDVVLTSPDLNVNEGGRVWLVVDRTTPGDAITIGWFLNFSDAYDAEQAGAKRYLLFQMVNMDPSGDVYFVVRCGGAIIPDSLYGAFNTQAEADAALATLNGYSFAFSVPTGNGGIIINPPIPGRAPAYTAAKWLIRQYWANQWARSSLNSDAPDFGPPVPHDPLCPLVFGDVPFDPDSVESLEMYPFIPSELRDQGAVGGKDYVPGVGFVHAVMSLDGIVPNAPRSSDACPRHRIRIDVSICTPPNVGTGLAERYLDWLLIIMRDVTLIPEVGSLAANSRLVRVQWAEWDQPFRTVTHRSTDGWLVLSVAIAFEMTEDAPQPFGTITLPAPVIA
jgi:hypothetical protein